GIPVAGCVGGRRSRFIRCRARGDAAATLIQHAPALALRGVVRRVPRRDLRGHGPAADRLQCDLVVVLAGGRAPRRGAVWKAAMMGLGSLISPRSTMARRSVKGHARRSMNSV